ncbi:type I-F CRISPR-associated protein Csy2 [Azomonas macrocytogenes]|uniref:CRISPR-associated protein Csy2 n=1 Tax=Azomonas macrocytogenes TaxID=69962 RepID=A0A839SZN6_AZOMA|nr:type I-F CRISPR-associated protein Csy2 [Azomonas macrocytogenes]MBB3102787.1 CRISPR-associated protein Csy2 [Azomonas macrocytogenes]
MNPALPESQGLLILPHLRIQNANAISSPLTHGFPSITAFLGLMWALERKLAEQDMALAFDSVGVICHEHTEQTHNSGYVQTFRLTRNPLDKDGSTAAIVEEGRIHLDITLVFGVTGDSQNNPVLQELEQRRKTAQQVGDTLATLRVAGGTLLPSRPGPGRRIYPQLIRLAEDAQERGKQFRYLRRQWLPGFALVSRDDLLQQRLTALQAEAPNSTALDAWLDLSRRNWRPRPDQANESGKVEWQHDRPAGSGWIVPIPVGYGALTDQYPAGSVQNARDRNIPFCFVESLYSMGQWISPHRLSDARELLWYAHTDESQGLYRCRNDFAQLNPASGN